MDNNIPFWDERPLGDNGDCPTPLKRGDEKICLRISKRLETQVAKNLTDKNGIDDIALKASYSFRWTCTRVYVEQLLHVLKAKAIELDPPLTRELDEMLKTLVNLDEFFPTQETGKILELLVEHDILSSEQIEYIQACLQALYKTSLAEQDTNASVEVAVCSCKEPQSSTIEAVKTLAYQRWENGHIDTDSTFSDYRDTWEESEIHLWWAGVSHGIIDNDDDDEFYDEDNDERDAKNLEFDDAEVDDESIIEEGTAVDLFLLAEKEMEDMFTVLHDVYIAKIVMGITPDNLSPYIEFWTTDHVEGKTLVYAIEPHMDVKTGFPIFQKLAEWQTYSEMFEHHMSLTDEQFVAAINAGHIV